MKTFKEIAERVKATPQTKAKLLKPLDRKTRSGIKLKVKNMMSDLDHIAWQFENQLDVNGAMTKAITKEADKIIKELKSFDKIL